MRIVAQIFLWLLIIVPAWAQNDEAPSGVTPEQRALVSDERAAQVRAVMATARKRQVAIDRQNTDLWSRWTHAVCLGCTPTPRGLRIVHTHPMRVLSGIPAARDDARERRGLRI